MTVNIRGMRRPPFVVTAFGLNGSGGVPIGGVNVGDIVENVRLITTTASASGSFETTVSVANEIKQTSSANLSANEYDFIVTPQS
jgi:hypothetical protein